MPTTTNYGWTTPADTDLVKDGAAAIRTLGSSADTTVKNLNPGTTAGDIDYYTSSTAKARIGIGTAGQVLKVNSGATAPEWGAPAAGLTLISTTTLSGATTTLSAIPQTYESLYIIASGMTANTSNQLFRMLPNNLSNICDTSMIENTTVITRKANALRITDADTLRTSNANAWSIYINNYTSTTAFKPVNWQGRFIDSASAAATIFGAGAIFTTSAITSLVFDYGGTNTFAGGTILLYGVS